MKIDLGKNELIHFVGIGGIGMSGLALIMNGLGYKVQGSDIAYNKNIERLNDKKIKIFLNHKRENIKKTTVLVISSAIKKSNPEIQEAIKKNLPIYTRGDMLGHIVSFMRNIVVTGSHGKTTTTSLVSNIFSTSKLDPTIINGGVLNSFGNSAKLGKSNWCVTESDESDGSFLNLPSTYSIMVRMFLIVPSEVILPSASAASIMAIPIRSFTEPSGLKNSHFRAMVASTPSVTLLSFTRGVLPTVSTMLL